MPSKYYHNSFLYETIVSVKLRRCFRGSFLLTTRTGFFAKKQGHDAQNDDALAGTGELSAEMTRNMKRRFDEGCIITWMQP
jgi:hypothetical protein